jgi:hypothetical protein
MVAGANFFFAPAIFFPKRFAEKEIDIIFALANGKTQQRQGSDLVEVCKNDENYRSVK